MADITIYLGNKNYSSWSMRGWLALKQTGEPFEEVVIPLYGPESRETILSYSPSGKVPAIRHGDVVVWESLAVAEYLAETFPAAGLWPEDPAARAHARAVSAEMHAGFPALRQELPMNVRRVAPEPEMSRDARDEVNRVTAIWRDCRRRHGAGGPYLFGEFTIADAMFAPVVSRFVTYQMDLDEDSGAYRDAIMSAPAMQEWVEAARNEPMIIDQFEV